MRWPAFTGLFLLRDREVNTTISNGPTVAGIVRPNLAAPW
jgi:hypothetical protein